MILQPLKRANPGRSLPYAPRVRFAANSTGSTLLLLAALFIALLGSAMGSQDLRVQGNALAVLVLAILIVRIDHRLMPGWLIGPGAFFCIHHVAAYSISPLGQLWLFGEVKRNAGLEGFVMAQQGAILGLATWALVYPTVFKRTFNATAAKTQGPPANGPVSYVWGRYGIALLILGILITVYQTFVGLSRVGGQGANVEIGTASVYAAFQYTPLVALFFLAFSAARRGRQRSALWLVSFTAFALWSFLDGSRSWAILALISSGCGFCFGGVARQKLVLGGLVAALLFVPIFGLVRVYRDTFTGSADSLSERWTGFQNTLTAFRSETDSVAEASQEFLQRISPDPVDYVFLRTPAVFPYAGFSGLDAIKYVYTPGYLSRDRPNLIDGNMLSIEYGAGRFGTTGNSLSVVADGYRRFSWPGISFLYALIASCSAVLAARAWKLRDRPEWIASMLVLLISLTGESTLATFLSTLYYALWTFPKYLLFFSAISLILRSLPGSTTAQKRSLISSRFQAQTLH